MAQRDEEVKPGLVDRFIRWIDCHPRTGWYVAVWVMVVTANTFWEILSGLIHWLT